MNPLFQIHDPIGLKLLTRLRVNLSHLREHKFRHNFLDTLNPLCSCGLEIESLKHYLLHCSFYTFKRKVLLDSVRLIAGNILDLPDEKLVNLLIFGDVTYTDEQNSSILRNTITFIKSSERFDVPLL